MSDVPCAGCQLCCKGDAVRLLPGDNPASFLTEPHPYMSGQRMIAHKPDGDCIYLTPAGCSIHHRKPRMCREMDCRRIASRIRRKSAEEVGFTRVWDRGRELLNQQEKA